MAVRILNDMPDAQVHRGEPGFGFLRELNAPRKPSRVSGRAMFLGATIALHVAFIAALMGVRYAHHAPAPEPIMATMFEAPRTQSETPSPVEPPIANLVYALPTPPELTFESEAIAAISPPATTTAEAPSPMSVAPPLVDSIEYLSARAPVFPRESQRRREYGTVVVRVLVDSEGLPAQLQIERSSGFERLDNAALRCVEKFRFRPYEVNGVAQAAQVLIPVGFDPPA